jgi:hypothetical protein
MISVSLASFVFVALCLLLAAAKSSWIPSNSSLVLLLHFCGDLVSSFRQASEVHESSLLEGFYIFSKFFGTYRTGKARRMNSPKAGGM